MTRKALVSEIAGCEVAVKITSASNSGDSEVGRFPGCCIDDLTMGAAPEKVDAEILRCENGDVVTEELYSHLLRSNCPGTHRPDIGSVFIRYAGAKNRPCDISGIHRSVSQALRFSRSLRRKNVSRYPGEPQTLTVYARFNRRGGLDINPFRTDTDSAPKNLRLWRQ